MKKVTNFLSSSPEFALAIAFTIALAIVVTHNTIQFGAFNPH